MRAGRVMKTQVGKIWMYFFPRREYCKESLIKQSLGAEQAKSGEGEFEKVEEALFKEFPWDPASLVPSGLQGLEGVGMLMGPSSSTPSTPQALPMSTDGGLFKNLYKILSLSISLSL